MSKLLITGQGVITPSNIIESASVLISDGKIEALLRETPTEGDFKRIDFEEGIVSPGFIDIHVHGADGHDTMDGTYEALNGMSNYLASTGTTGFLATTVTASHDDIVCAIKAVKESKERVEGAALLGVHLEGPYINAKKKGAQNGNHVRNPNPIELAHYAELLGEDFKLITLAPELDEDFKTIKYAKQKGAAVSAGHSCCSYETAIQSFDAGISHATHLFNGMEPLLHREPGLVGAFLSDPRVSAEIIADGIHLHSGVMKLILAAKGLDKTVLVTDCIRAGNMTDGTYDLGGLNITVKNGIARTDFGGLAGSTLQMIHAVKNMVRLCDVPLKDAVHLASKNSADVIGLGNRKGTIEAGKDADITVFNEQFEVLLTVVNGIVKFKK